MHTPKIIIHRLDAPWLRECGRPRRRLHRRLLITAGAVAGCAIIIGTLAGADDPDITPHAPPVRLSLTQK